jgi:DNA-3-methyladenine glycosylase
VVTNREGSAVAVLIRAVEPLEGVEMMMSRRRLEKFEKRLTAGPGSLSRALGIEIQHNGTAMNSDVIWMERGVNVNENDIVSTTRIGVDYAEEDALKPWRFYIKENGWVSKF